jgi:cytosine deaminase
MQQLREEWAGRICLQTVSLCGVEQYATKAGEKIADMTLRYPDASLGGMPQMEPDLDHQLDRLLDLAAERGSGIDLHIDENGDAGAECLRHLAEAVLRKDFQQPVIVGHACSLAVQDPARAAETIALVKAAGISVISLPLCNLFLQDRRRDATSGARQTPRWRGLTLLHELRAAGVPVACASDNVRDAFYAFGDFDPFEVLLQSIRIGHLDADLDWAPGLVACDAAAIMRLPSFGKIAPGSPAQMQLFEAHSFNELLARPRLSRRLLNFHPAARLPAYEELGVT